MATNKPELVICRGLQASGKTTWANAWVAEDRANRARVNRDDLRQMLDNGVFEAGVTEGRILVTRNAAIKSLLLRGVSVVSDDTNLARRNVVDLARIAHRGNYPWRIQDFTDVPVEVCLQRNTDRNYNDARLYGGKHFLDNQVLHDTYDRYLRKRNFMLPTEAELADATVPVARPYVPKPGTTQAIIVDIDGTVALRGTRSPFDESRVHEDRPNIPVIEIVQLEILGGAYPIFVSGRSNGCFATTMEWLAKWVLQDPGGGGFALFMRRQGDNRKDAEVKMEIFDQLIRDTYNVVRVYDDRNQVVEMWRSLGLTVCQVAPGDF